MQITTPPFTIIHDAISPTADVVTETELREYLADMLADDPERGWQHTIDTLTVRDDGIYADTGDGLGLVHIAVPAA